MKTNQNDVTYSEWLSAEIMHIATQKWLSELLFAKDEQLFFDDLIRSYTLNLIDSKYFPKSKKIIEKLHELKKQTNTLITSVKKHENELEIMVNKKDEFDDEINYRNTHRKLMVILSEYSENFKAIKKQLFKLIKGILKEKKQKLLLQ